MSGEVAHTVMNRAAGAVLSAPSA